jgi:hypothetical protein
MSDYLKNLQESNAVIHGFIRNTNTKSEGPKPLVESDEASKDDKTETGEEK